MKSFSQIRAAGIELCRRAREAALSLFYPPHCAVCEAETATPGCLCPDCLAKARRIAAPFCAHCSQPFDGSITGEFICANCRDRRFHFACAVAAYRGQGVVRDLIHRFKYNRHFYLRHQLAAWMADGLADARMQTTPIDAFVPVPLHPAKEREREFNQADVLGRLLAQRCGIPVARALKRIRYTTTQTRLDREERMENLRGAFKMREGGTVTGRHLLLLDDVFTTGSTVDECSRLLCQAGAASVRVLTVARA